MNQSESSNTKTPNKRNKKKIYSIHDIETQRHHTNTQHTHRAIVLLSLISIQIWYGIYSLFWFGAHSIQNTHDSIVHFIILLYSSSSLKNFFFFLVFSNTTVHRWREKFEKKNLVIKWTFTNSNFIIIFQINYNFVLNIQVFTIYSYLYFVLYNNIYIKTKK